MKKVIGMVALAAILAGSVGAHAVTVKSSTANAQQDTTKKKVKVKDGKVKKKEKTKKDTTATKM